MNKYILLKEIGDTVYGVEYGIPYTIIGYTNCCYIIKNNSGTTIEINRDRVVELHTLEPRCIEEEIDTTIKTNKYKNRF